MNTYKIAVINGDGIGHEIVPAAMKLVHKVADKHDFKIEEQSFPFGAGYYKETGQFMPDDGLSILKEFDAILFGAVGLPEVTVYNIPSREFFKQEFLAMEVIDPLGERARENLSAGLMQDILESLPVDGTEVARSTLRQTAQAYYYEGQFRPQNIFNPLAWKKFIDSWRNGDFKKKKDKDK